MWKTQQGHHLGKGEGTHKLGIHLDQYNLITTVVWHSLLSLVPCRGTLARSEDVQMVPDGGDDFLLLLGKQWKQEGEEHIIAPTRGDVYMSLGGQKSCPAHGWPCPLI